MAAVVPLGAAVIGWGGWERDGPRSSAATSRLNGELVAAGFGAEEVPSGSSAVRSARSFAEAPPTADEIV